MHTPRVLLACVESCPYTGERSLNEHRLERNEDNIHNTMSFWESGLVVSPHVHEGVVDIDVDIADLEVVVLLAYRLVHCRGVHEEEPPK